MDRRVRKTREALLSAVIEIAASGNWPEASINEICDRADIARSTFYLHFADKSQLTDYALAALEETIKETKSVDSLEKTGIFTFLLPLIKLAVDPVHSFLFSTDANAHDHHEISDRFRLMIERLVQHEVTQAREDYNLNWAHQSFLAGGIHSFVQSCHNREQNDGTTETAEDLLACIAPLLKYNIEWKRLG